MPLILLSTILLIFTLSGCGGWKNGQSISTVVWADDGSEIAFIQSDYQYKDLWPTGAEIKNEKYQLKITDRNRTYTSNIGPEFSGQVTTLYYKKSAGYFVMGKQESETTATDYYVLDMKGNILHEISAINNLYCPTSGLQFHRIRALPSPDGRIIAVAQTTTNCEIQIHFLDLQNNFTSIDSQRVTGRDINIFYWGSDSRLILSTCNETCGDKNWLITLNQPPAEIEYNTINNVCVEGLQKSSPINAQGEILLWNKPKEKMRILSWTAYQQEFNLDDAPYIEYGYGDYPGCLPADNL